MPVLGHVMVSSGGLWGGRRVLRPDRVEVMGGMEMLTSSDAEEHGLAHALEIYSVSAWLK